MLTFVKKYNIYIALVDRSYYFDTVNSQLSMSWIMYAQNAWKNK